MKRIFALILAVMMLGTACLAEELPEIRFLGVAFGTTLGEIEAEANKNIFAASPSYGYVPRVIDELITGSDTFMLVSDDIAGDAVLQESCSEVQEVAGHSCTTNRYYVRPVIDGELDMNDDHAILYAGRYRINNLKLIEDKSEMIINDLTEKLTQLYGTPVVEEREEVVVVFATTVTQLASVTTWYGADNVEVVLYSSSSGQVILTYVWRDAQALIDAACECIDVETVDNSINFGGL